MNKSQLIEALAARYEGNRKQAAHALESVLDTITREVVKGEKVGITGFGSFEKKVRDARWVRNPRTGERIKAKKTAIPKFNAGAELKAVVSGAKKLPKLTAAKAAAGGQAAKKAGAGKSTASSASSASKSTSAKKSATKSTATKTAKSTARKTATSDGASKRSTTKKSTASASPAKKATTRKTSASKAPAKKSTTSKATASKTTAKKSTGKRAAAKKS